MGISNKFRDDLLAAIPSLRAFGLSLTARGDRADDLVQEIWRICGCQRVDGLAVREPRLSLPSHPRTLDRAREPIEAAAETLRYVFRNSP